MSLRSVIIASLCDLAGSMSLSQNFSSSVSRLKQIPKSMHLSLIAAFSSPGRSALERLCSKISCKTVCIFLGTPSLLVLLLRKRRYSVFLCDSLAKYVFVLPSALTRSWQEKWLWPADGAWRSCGGALYALPVAGVLDLTRLVGRRSMFVFRLSDLRLSLSLSGPWEDYSLSESSRTMAFPLFGTLGP